MSKKSPLLSLVKFLLHMLRTWPVQARKSPYKLIFFITDRCDSHCQTCGTWRRGPDVDQEPNTEQILRITKSLADSLYWVTIQGGEPTMREDFPKIVHGIADSCPNLIILNFSTNGIESERVLKQVRAAVNADIPYLIGSVSIDGIGELHDEVRGTPGAFENIEKTISGLLAIEKEFPNFHLSFETVVTRLNRHALQEIHDYVARFKGNHTHVFTLADESFLIGRGPSENVRSDGGDAFSMKEMAVTYRLKGIFDLIPLAYLGLADYHFSSRGNRLSCVAVRDVLTIDPIGEARYCYFHERSIGSLRDFNWDAKALLKSEKADTAFSELASCKKCYSPCMAFPSLFRSPFLVMLGLGRSFGWKCLVLFKNLKQQYL